MEGLYVFSFPSLTWQADTAELLKERYLLNAIYSYLHVDKNPLHMHRYVSQTFVPSEIQNISHKSLGVLCFCFFLFKQIWKIVLNFICSQAD